MIIAEKILNSKSMRSISFAEYIRACQSGTSSGGDTKNEEQSIQIQKEPEVPDMRCSELINPAANMKLLESEVPEWLKNDIAEADFIPIKTRNEKTESQTNKYLNKEPEKQLNDASWRQSFKVYFQFFLRT